MLPGTGASLVLVTSRRHLSALEDLAAISLDTLPLAEAAGLLAQALKIFRRIGAAEAGDLTAELDAVRAVASQPPDAAPE